MKLAKKLPLLVSSTFFLFCCLFPQVLQAQAPGCGTDDIHSELLKRNPDFQKKQKEAESRTYKTLQQQYKNKQRNTKSNACGEEAEEIYRIPIVVHIMHLPEDSIPGMGSNLSEAQILAGVEHLNQAFRNEGTYAGGPYHTSATNFGVQSEDVKIEFVLAKRDPSGAASDGINRISTTYSNLAYASDGPTGSSQDSYLKSLSFWDSREYANVWLVNEICKYEPDSICGVAGYAYLAGAHGASYDGIVNEGRYWGSSANASKVHIHEFGHYLNLYHTFNDPDGTGSKSPCENGDCLRDGDYVCDTPPDNSSSAVSCGSSNTANSCSTDADDTSSNNPFTSDVDDMYENYMDYGYQSCQNTFTQGQKDRMRLALSTTRASLLSSQGLTAVNVADASIEEISSPFSSLGCASFSPTISLKSQGDLTLSSAKIGVSLDGVFNHAVNWTGSLATGASETVTLTSITSSTGSHNISIYLQEINGSSTDGDSGNDTASLCFEIYTPTNSLPYCQDFESLSGSPANWSETNSTGADLWGIYNSGTGCSSDLGSAAYYLNSWSGAFGSTGADLDLHTASIDLTGVSDAKLSFARSYARSFSSRKLELEIAISIDCGSSFQTLQSWDNDQLATSQDYEYVNAWVPGSCNDWSNDTLDLSAYADETILIRFRSKVQAYYAQNLYLDNICVIGSSANSCASLNLSTGHTGETCGQGNGGVSVQATSGTAPYSYSWNTQPIQTTSTATNVSAGTYQVIVTDSAGCKDTANVTLQNTGNPPTADYSFQKQGLNFSATNQSSSDLSATYIWDFGDGNSSSLSDPTHTYSLAGIYTVCLYTTNSCGTDTLCQQVNIDCPKPITAFSTSTDDLSASFTNSTTGANAFLWKFGDGNTSTQQSPSHSYRSAGTYTVCLTTSNSCGAETVCHQVTVTCPVPVAGFDHSSVGLLVSYTNTSDPGTYVWDFGDGSSSASENPAHLYSSAGTYTVCLYTTNICGTDTTCKQISVACPQPTASFSKSISNLLVSFDNGSSGASSYSWDFGDGSSSTDENPNHTYNSAGTYTVCLYATNTCGTDTSCIQVSVDCPQPTASFSKSISNLQVSFDNGSSGASSYSWDFGDGSSSTDENPNHTYNSVGTYTVCLYATNTCGTDTSCIQVSVNCPKPDISFSRDINHLQVNFVNNTAQADAYFWDLGDGNTSSTQNPSHTYASAGTYMVCLTATNACGSDSICQQITVDCPVPTANFGFGINKLGVNFINNSTSADSYNWDFGDGNSSTEVNATHNYAMAGTYNVCLISSNSCGSDTSCMEITVDCPYPVSAFSPSADELTVTFTNTSSEGDNYSWNFGDGDVDTVVSPTHNYAEKGTYTVCLISSNMCGADTTCQQITVTCTDPIAAFTHQADNLTVSFTDSSFNGSSYSWTFGDGNSSQEANPLYTYADTGSYEVCLIVENVCGADTLCRTITVICPEPVAAFTPDASGLNMIFIDQSVNSNAYSWDFGDGSSSKLPRPFYTYDLPGTYTVCQTVFNDCGQDSICQTVTVSCPGPKAQFNYTTTDLKVDFSSTSSTGATYAWDFGDGNTSKEYAPSHTYDTSGVYAVNLIVSTICGVDTASTEIDLREETTSIDPESLIAARVYPNPSKGIFYLEMEELPGEEILLEVHDSRGKLILKRDLNSFRNKSKEVIDLQEYPKGVYFLSLRSDSKQFVQKLSLEN